MKTAGGRGKGGGERAYVIANFAMTWDGKITTRTREPSLFTSARDKRRLVEIRSLGDAVMAGRGTVEADTMSMGLKDEGLRRVRVARGQAEYPLRVVVTGSGRVDPGWRVFHTRGGEVVIVTGTPLEGKVREFLAGRSDVRVLEVVPLDVREVLVRLRREFGVRVVVCEGGAALFRALVGAGVVDELFLTVAPRIFGGMEAPTLTGTEGGWCGEELRMRLLGLEEVEGEVFLRYVRRGVRLQGWRYVLTGDG